MEVFYTVISGVLVYVFGKIFNKFYVDPIHEQKETIGKIADALIFYAYLYSNIVDTHVDLGKERLDAQHLFRKLASQLMSRSYQIPNYKTLSLFRFVVDKQRITDAHHQLIGLSNSMSPRDTNDLRANSDQKKELCRLLNLVVK